LRDGLGDGTGRSGAGALSLSLEGERDGTGDGLGVRRVGCVVGCGDCCCVFGEREGDGEYMGSKRTGFGVNDVGGSGFDGVGCMARTECCGDGNGDTGTGAVMSNCWTGIETWICSRILASGLVWRL
jgi:hypothetical protein